MELNTCHEKHIQLSEKFFDTWDTLGVTIESNYYGLADKMIEGYEGGSWLFNEVPESSALYLVLDSDKTFHVNALNGNELDCNAVVISMAITLIIYSSLSFRLHEKGDGRYTVLSQHFHQFRGHFLDSLSEEDASKLLRIVD